MGTTSFDQSRAWAIAVLTSFSLASLSSCAATIAEPPTAPNTPPVAAPSSPRATAIAAAPPTKGQRTYHIGNSLTDSINTQLAAIAKSAGYNHEYLRSTIPGAPTDWNWDHPGTALGEKDYRTVFATKAPIDHLFTQPYAGHNRSIENEADYSGRFYALAREKSPNIQPWLYAQWPAQAMTDAWTKATGSAANLGLVPARTWEDGVRNQLAYHEAVRQKMDAAHGGKPILIVPGGLALASLKQAIATGKVPGITEFFATQFEDNIHLSRSGEYLIALVHYASIYQRSPKGVTYANSGLTAEQAAIYQRIAWDTVCNYRWTQVQCAAKPPNF